MYLHWQSVLPTCPPPAYVDLLLFIPSHLTSSIAVVIITATTRRSRLTTKCKYWLRWGDLYFVMRMGWFKWGPQAIPFYKLDLLIIDMKLLISEAVRIGSYSLHKLWDSSFYTLHTSQKCSSAVPEHSPSICLIKCWDLIHETHGALIPSQIKAHMLSSHIRFDHIFQPETLFYFLCLWTKNKSYLKTF